MILPILSAILTLTHVNVVDVAGARVRTNVTVHIASDIDGTVDATGKFLIPGLWDMHTHLPDDQVGREAYLALFVANGVTGIRVMEGSPELYRWRDDIAHGSMSGPRMIVASAILDGPKSFLPDAVKVETAEAAREAVRAAKKAGADFIKVYDNLERAPYEAIIEEARTQRLAVAGHVPIAIGVEGVARRRQLTIEHMTGISDARSFALLRRNGVRECPTLIMRHNYAYLDDRDLANDPRLAYVKPSTRARWLRMIGEGTPERKAAFAREEQLLGAMAKAGIAILAGTDNGNPFCYPGFSLHDELALLVDAGLTPAQALRAATVEAGKVAGVRDPSSFVLLDANPLEDIHHTKRIYAVVLRGRFLDRKMLDGLLAKARDVVDASR